MTITETDIIVKSYGKINFKAWIIDDYSLFKKIEISRVRYHTTFCYCGQ